MLSVMLVSAAIVFSGLRLIQCFSSSRPFECHDDPSVPPEAGILDEVFFNWLGILQYIHIKNGTPHFFRVPRVVLISRQFALCTAKDASHVPEGYALGNVAFGEYERDDEECGLTYEVLNQEAQCPITGLLVPLSDVIVHPEYKENQVPYSIALLKLLVPIRSKYMIPVCLPHKNYVWTMKQSTQIQYKLIHLDYVTPVPRNYIEEEREVLRISPLPRDICFLYDREENRTKLQKHKIMCTSGCDFHSGAPSLVHEHTGHWSLVSISQGGTSCLDPLRETTNQPPPPRHTLIYPYVSWITSIVLEDMEGHSVEHVNPFGYVMTSRMSNTRLGRWWMGGYRCYDRGPSSDNLFKFYSELFEMKFSPEVGAVTYLLEIISNSSLIIDCVKIGPINKFILPEIWGMETNHIKVRIPMSTNTTLKFQVHAWAHVRPDDMSFEDQPLDFLRNEYSDEDSSGQSY